MHIHMILVVNNVRLYKRVACARAQQCSVWRTLGLSSIARDGRLESSSVLSP
jgi:hypothetical protein